MYTIHLKKVAGAAATYGKQYGALVLCTAAVTILHFMLLIHAKCFLLYQTERALGFWASGKDMSMKMDDNGKHKLASLFGELEWGRKACGWSQSTKQLALEQWMLVESEATACGKKLPQDEANGKDNLEVDPRAVLEL